ncbi:putative Chromatin modification-related protein MEAF6 [Nannochloris sp. 'desiccata']|nr:hypothetical protein KSW81_000854 [Chlorella desiccata (nom. nud.)]KAH7620469.1 putative Chromatin modification-related protein MEAF6 [Chlorella desiccata (nom. nud.)]
MGSNKNKSKETKKAGGTPKSAKKFEKEKSEPPKSGKKGEPKELKALLGGKKRSEPEAVAAPPYQPETSELEKKRLQVSEELRKVETQIHDLETKYLEQSSAFGNAVRGYEGFLGGLSQANRKIIIKPEERLFSMSSSSSVPP